jgi:hypothetical protein
VCSCLYGRCLADNDTTSEQDAGPQDTPPKVQKKKVGGPPMLTLVTPLTHLCCFVCSRYNTEDSTA